MAATATDTKSVTLTFEVERETKGTFRFQEKLETDLDEPKIGSLYVRKSALRGLGWDHGDLHVTLSA